MANLTYISSGPADARATVDHDGTPVDRVGVGGFAYKGQDRKYLTGNSMIGPTSVVKLVDFAF